MITDSIPRAAYAVIMILVTLGLIFAFTRPLQNVAQEGTCAGTSMAQWFIYSLRGVNLINHNHNSQLSTGPSSFCQPVKIIFKKKATDETIKKTVAEEMAQCWKDYNRGRYPLYQVDPGRDLYCAICAKVDFSNVRGRNIDNYQDYLLSTPANPAKGTSYIEYLSNADIENISLAPYEGGVMNIDTNKDYAVMIVQTTDANLLRYFFSKNSKWQNVLEGSAKGGTIGQIAGGTAGLSVGGALGIVAAGAIAATGVGAAVELIGGVLIAGGAAAGGISGYLAGGKVGAAAGSAAGAALGAAASNINLHSRIVLTGWSDQAFNNMGCYQVDAVPNK